MDKLPPTNISYDRVNINESSNLEIPPANLVPENQSKHFLSTLLSLIQGRSDSVAIATVGIVALVVICLAALYR